MATCMRRRWWRWPIRLAATDVSHTLPAGATLFTTVELKSNFLGTATEGTIACVARPAHLGNTTQVWDAIVTGRASARTIALFRCTQLVIWPRK
jgi:1,4-dihydroxy-2-naphthoyl-CoA hydrolase